jgi:hypothetical protein
LLAAVRGFNESIQSGEDVELMFRMAANASGARACNAFTYRRTRADSVSKKVLSDRTEYIRIAKLMLSYQNGKYQHLKRETMHAIHTILAGKCWEADAFCDAAMEALRAAFWKPSCVLDRNFIDILILGHIYRFLRVKRFGNE